MTLLNKALSEQTFVCILEFVPKPDARRFAAVEALMARSQLCGWPLTLAIADRVGNPLEMSPLEAFRSLGQPVPALLHFSGKDRERQDLLAQLPRMDAAGVQQLLLLTGDRLPGQRPVRYLESVAALQSVRQARPHWWLAAALNPFKYREEEGGAQYFKAEKKLAAGADCFMLQLGFDAQKHLEAIAWMNRQPNPKPLIACILALTQGRARMLDQVAGVVVTPSMRALVDAEAAVSKHYARERSIERLALQAIGLKLMGYAGINLSGIHDLDQLLALEQAINAWQPRVPSLEQWRAAWDAAWRMPGLGPVSFHPAEANWRLGESRVGASPREQARYHLLHGMHSLLFDRSTWTSRAFGWAMRRPVWSSATGARWLHRLERGLKRPLLGCDTCGSCRLEDTLYICPETCPKGLANGPCGGTSLNRCEFGDRECIHSVKYRTAKAVGQSAVLSQRLIPCVEVGNRHRSSWPRWFDNPPSTAQAPRHERDNAGTVAVSKD